MAVGLAPGAKCPDVTLVGGDGTRTSLAAQAQQGPLVVVFYHLAFTGG